MVKCCTPKYTSRQLRETISIQALTRTSDGMGGFTEAWTEVGGSSWVLIASDVVAAETSISFQNIGVNDVFVKATTGAAPTDLLGSLLYPADTREVAITLDQLFPGLPSATHLWAFSVRGSSLSISYSSSEPTTISVTRGTSVSRAMIDAAPGSERWGYMRQVPSNTYRMVTRYFSGATAAQRVQWNGKTYAILGVVDPDGGKRWLEYRLSDGAAP